MILIDYGDLSRSTSECNHLIADYQLRILDIPAGRFTKSRDEDNPLLTRELESYDKQSEKFRSLETYIEVGVTYRQNGEQVWFHQCH